MVSGINAAYFPIRSWPLVCAIVYCLCLSPVSLLFCAKMHVGIIVKNFCLIPKIWSTCKKFVYLLSSSFLAVPFTVL